MKKLTLVTLLVAILIVAGNLVAQVNLYSTSETVNCGPDIVNQMNLYFEISGGDQVTSITMKYDGIDVGWLDYDRFSNIETGERINCSVFSDNINQEKVVTFIEPLTGFIGITSTTTVFLHNTPSFHPYIESAEDIESSSGNVNGIFPLIGNNIYIYGNLFNVMGDTIQSGINSAQNGDVVLVQSDIYYENLTLVDKDIRIISMNELLGPTYPIGETIINGNSSGRCFTANFSSFEIAGFTFTDGVTSDNGGGINIDMCHNSVIRNCLIIGNQTTNGYNGSGVYMSYSNNVTISNVEISDNSATGFGGGVACHNSSVDIVENCHIANNESNDNGGGLYAFNSEIFLKDTFVMENQSNNCGGGLYTESSELNIDSYVEFNSNSTQYQGGGIYAESCTLQIYGSNFFENEAETAGALALIYSPSEIEGCFFVGNQANSLAGGVFNSHGNISIKHCEFSNNIATWTSGGAFYNQYSEFTIEKCLFHDNRSGIMTGGGSAIFLNESENGKIIGTTIAHNYPVEGQDFCPVIYSHDSEETLLLNSVIYQNIGPSVAGNSPVRCVHSDLYGNNGDWTENTIDDQGNISLNPQFTPYYLPEQNSPCIDTGIDYFEWNGEVYEVPEYNDFAPDMGFRETNYPVFVNPEGIPEVKTNLIGNYPNPFNPSTAINFNVAKQSDVELSIYNVKGQKVTTLVNEQINAGSHTRIWNGTDQNNNAVSSGVYFYKLTSDRYSEIKKMILAK
jgi:predicted outer membrane repeat protein